MKANFFTFMAIFLFAGCASQQLTNKETVETASKSTTATIKHTFTKESAMSAVQKVFEAHNLPVYESNPSKGIISFQNGVLIPAMPDKDGEFKQPVMSIGFDRGFFFIEAIYEVTLKQNHIKIRKTTASFGSPFRAVAQVESDILQDIINLVSVVK